MDVIERGAGTPLVLVPGLQGRWEYLRPAIEALATHFRVVTFSLSGERVSGRRYDRLKGIDNFVEQVDDVLAARAIDRAVVCGLSFGGLVALRFAARRPERAHALVLVSTPGPGWHLKRRHDVYARLPWMFGPLFLAESPWRMRDELRAAFPNPRDRRRFVRAQVATFIEAPLSMSRMAARARLIARLDTAAECRLVACPTLVVTGEPGLDHVIAAERALAYGTLIHNARSLVLEGTGHLGLVTRPSLFAASLKAFVDQAPLVDSTPAPPASRSSERGPLQAGATRHAGAFHDAL
jgi:pimeloyl-ACP methyl ester carboxylesterase